MKYLALIFFTLFVLFACKKDTDSPDLCTNGYLDIGETGVDCGGPCKACQDTYYPYLSIKLNQQQITFTNKTFTETNNKWSLKFWNDSIQVQMELGETLIKDSLYDIASVNTFMTYFGIVYPLTTPYKPTNLAISDIAIQDRRISGYFSSKFYRAGFMDTMTVSGGNFLDLPF